LPPEIGLLTTLEILDLQENQLRALPPEIGRLTELHSLDLRENQLTTLPPEMGKLHGLRVGDNALGLRLDDNPLSHPYAALIAKGQPSATLDVLFWLRGELPLLPPAQEVSLPEPPPELPSQVPGPHFEISDDGVINFAPPEALDREGNNVARLRRLHPSVRTLSANAVETLGQGNRPHGHLLDRAKA
jgi:Leucine-rich repeat (LRR) protein